MEKKLRIGLVGCGGMGAVHCDAYRHMPNTEVVALCDIVDGRAEEYAKNFQFENCKTSKDYMDLVNDPQIDAIDITTPNYLHSIIAIAALQAGKHVFSEKPDCMLASQAEEMKAAAEKADKVLMVMRNNRYYHGSKFVKNFIRDGKMGEIYAGRCGWIRRRGIPGKGGWFTTKEQSGGGPLIDLGVHMIDLSIWLMGNPRPVAVSGCTFTKFANDDAEADSVHASYGEKVDNGVFDVEDLAMGFIRFDNGACLQIEFSWASNIEDECKFVELRGTKAGCSIVNENDVKISGEEYGYLYDLKPRTPGSNGHMANIVHFVDVVLNGKKPDFEPIQGVNMIKILNAIYESAKTGKEVLL